MATGQWVVVLRHVQRLFHGGSVSGLSEAQLLERFASTRDEVAFEAILARHGPMVLGVCRGVLDDPNDVEDAFQATFLVLVKKAGALRDADRLAQWLYGVARRVSLRARSDSIRRKARERSEALETIDPHATLDADLRELQVLIREEVDRLSSNDRMAVVLCYLEGLTHEEAADRLGWPVGTVKGRLARARDKLRDRLSRRGVALPAAVIASGFAEAARATVPATLLRSTTLAAIQVATGKTLTAGFISAHAIALMEGVIDTMFATKLKIVASALVATCFIAVPGVVAFQGPGPANEQVKAPKKSDQPPAAKGSPAPDPSAAELVQLSEDALAFCEKMMTYSQNEHKAADVALWSIRLLQAKAGPDAPESTRKAAFQAHRDRMKKQVDNLKEMEGPGKPRSIHLIDAQYRLAEADRWLRDGQITASAKRPVKPEGFEGGDFDSGPARKPLVLKTMPGDEKRNEAINAMLETPIAMNFAIETPLEDVKKYIQVATQDEAAGLPNGIPIYVDTQALQDSDNSMASTIQINLEGVALRSTLRLVLHQLKLDYRVEGGLLLITKEDSMLDEMRKARMGGPMQKGMGGGPR